MRLAPPALLLSFALLQADLLAYAHHDSPLRDAVPVPGSIFNGGERLESTDLDGDGRVDLVLWGVGGNVAVSYCQSDGTFELPRNVVRAVDDVMLRALTVGDVDLDGVADFVTVNSAGTLETFLGSDGTWRRGPSGPFFGQPYCFVDSQLVDVDGDGVLDFASDVGFCGGLFPGTRVALGNGDGSFGAFNDPVAGGWVHQGYQFVDVDGDGDVDMVSRRPRVAGTTYLVGVVVNTGSYPLDPANALLLNPAVPGGLIAWDLLVGDEEGDGDLDLFVLSRTATDDVVYLATQTSAGVFGAPRVVASSAFSTMDSPSRTISGLDVEGDGDLDLVLSTEGVDRTGGEFVYLARDPQGYASPVLTDFGNDGGRSIALGDFDGDGLGEVISSGTRRDDPATTVVEALPQISHIRADAAAGPALWETSPINEEFGGDGWLVPLADGEASSLLVLDSTGPKMLFKHHLGDLSFSPQEDAVTLADGTSRFSDFLFNDLNGDDSTDILVRSRIASELRFDVYLGDGAGAFHPASTFNLAAPNLPFSVGEPLLADLDGDGDLDLLADDEIGDLQLGLLNDGSGRFGSPYTLFPGPLINRQLRVADIDSDGVLDLAIRTQVGALLAVGLGDGTFGLPTPLRVEPGFTDVTNIADVDGDGTTDLLVLGAVQPGSYRELRWSRGLGGALFEPSQFITNVPPFFDLLVKDLDLDGDIDIVLSSDEEVLALENAGQGSFRDFPVTASPGIPQLGDADNDGDPDILSFSTPHAQGHAWITRNTYIDDVGSGFCGPAVPNSTGAPAVLTATGSERVDVGRLRLDVTGLPAGSTGVFLASLTQGQVSSVPGSIGTLCLGGAIGRFVGPGQVQNASASGAFSLEVALMALPNPAQGLVAALPGQTWSFQAWYQDTLPAGGATSNFSTARFVELR